MCPQLWCAEIGRCAKIRPCLNQILNEDGDELPSPDLDPLFGVKLNLFEQQITKYGKIFGEVCMWACFISSYFGEGSFCWEILSSCNHHFLVLGHVRLDLCSCAPCELCQGVHMVITKRVYGRLNALGAAVMEQFSHTFYCSWTCGCFIPFCLSSISIPHVRGLSLNTPF